jgi:hypothetical protein
MYSDADPLPEGVRGESGENIKEEDEKSRRKEGGNKRRNLRFSQRYL